MKILLCLLGLAAAIVRIPLEKEKVSPEESLSFVKSLKDIKKANVPITNFQNSQYYASISVGTPAQKFSVKVTTLIGNMYLPSVNCFSITCHVHRTYNSAKSSTYSKNGYPINISNSTGYLSQDTVVFGGISVPNFIFAEMTTLEGSEWFTSRYDCLLYTSDAADE